MLEPGIKGRQETIVDAKNIAVNVASGTVRVFATPMMIALMEKTAALSVEPYLDKGCSTVGIRVDVSHLAATPEGVKVWAESELIDVDRRRLTFKVSAYDEAGLIGEGIHERFIINVEKFYSRALEKTGKKQK